MKRIYILFTIIFLSTFVSQAQDPAISFDLDQELNTSMHYIASDYINCLPNGTSGFSFTAGTGMEFTAEIDPFLVFPPDEGDEQGDPIFGDYEDLFVGETPGSFNISPTGAVLYTVPLKLPEGINEMIPSLAITYNSQAGNGNMGFGWSISGLSAITRIGNDWYHDGNNDPVDFDDNDKFALDGNRLIIGNLNSVYGMAGSQYTTEIYTGSRITAYGQKGSGPEYFKVESLDGNIYYYGNSEDSKTIINYDDDESVFSWAVSKIEDRFGNEINYTYHNSDGEIKISEISYGGNDILDNDFVVSFVYKNELWREDSQVSYHLGNKFKSKKLLDYISIKRNDNELHRYECYYKKSLSRQTCLERIYEYGIEGKRIAPLAFEYGDGSYDINFTELELKADYALKEEIFHHDINGDGRSDIIILKYSYKNDENDKKKREYSDWKYRLSLDDGLSEEQSFETSISPYFKEFQFGDFNGDGRQDLAMISWNSLTRDDMFYIDKVLLMDENQQFNTITSLGTNFSSSHAEDAVILVGDFNGNGKTNFLKAKRSQYVAGADNVWVSELNAEEQFGVILGFDYWFGIRLENQLNLVGNYISGPKQSILVTRNWGEEDACNIISCNFETGDFQTHWNTGYPTVWHRVFPMDFNADGLTDILTLNHNSDTPTWSISLSNGLDGWVYSPAIIELPLMDPYDSDGLFVFIPGDYNGDGMLDILSLDKDYHYQNDCRYRLLLNNGNQFERKDGSIEHKGKLAQDGDNLSINQKYDFKSGADINGDGISDILSFQVWDEHYPQEFILARYGYYSFNVTERSHIVKRIKILGKKIEFDIANEYHNNYTPSYDSYYETDNTIVDFNFYRPVCVESRIYNTDDQYTTQRFQYGGALYNKKAFKFLGYKSIKTIDELDENKELITKNIFKLGYNNYILDLDESTKEIYNGSYSMHLTNTINTWQTSLVTVLDDASSIFNFISLSNTKQWEFNNYNTFIKTTRQRNSFNLNAYLEESISLTDSENIDITEPDTEFDYKVHKETQYKSFQDGNFIIEMPEKIITTSNSAYSEETYEKIDGITYYNLSEKPWVMVKTKTKNDRELTSGPLPEMALVQSYIYDDFGRVIEEKYATPAYSFNNELLDSRIIKYYFGDNNQSRYLTTIENAEGHQTSYEEFNVFGYPTKITDPNKQVTITEYDWFGNRRKTVYPDGVIKLSGAKWAELSNDLGALFYTWAITSGGTHSKVYYDKYGYKILLKTIDYHGNEVLSSNVYDDKGRLKYTYNPEIDGVKDITRFQYDGLNRQVRTDFHLANEDDQSVYYSINKYNGLEQKVCFGTADGEESKKTIYFASGNVKEIHDEKENIIHHKYYANSLLKETTVFENTTRFEYDINGNKKLMDDPSLGFIRSKYNPYGEVVQYNDNKHLDPDLEGKYYEYDRIGRLIKTVDFNGSIVDTKYDYPDKPGLLSKVELTVGDELAASEYLNEIITYIYDDKLRVLSEDYLINNTEHYNYSYSYDNLGRVKSMTYPTGLKIKNKYNSKGYLVNIMEAESNNSLWKVGSSGYDKLGRLTDYVVNSDLGAITTNSTFDPKTGLLTDIDTYNSTVQLQDWHYEYDVLGNMKSRSHIVFANEGQANPILLSESFTYDELNRLEDATVFCEAKDPFLIDYDYYPNGSIKKINNIGDFKYDETPTAGPYALSGINFNEGMTNPSPQTIEYTSFDKVKNLSEIGIGDLGILYGVDKQRLYQKTTLDEGTIKEKYFIGGVFEKEIIDGETRELCYIRTPAGTVAVKETHNNEDNWYFLSHDHLGSVHCILNEEGELLQELSFDPYGNRRDPYTWQPFAVGNEPEYILDRGYTMHEHWDNFALINMNGRVYDPGVCGFLSPDPFVQSPGFSQNYNRYIYAFCNPLKFTDPSGEIVWAPIIVMAIMAGASNWAANGMQKNGNGFAYFSIGFSASFAGGLAGAAVGGAMSIGGFVQGAAVGGVVGFSSGFTIGAMNSWYRGDSFSTGISQGFKYGSIGGLSSALIGGVINGSLATLDNKNFWTGNDQGSGRSLFALNNSDKTHTHYKIGNRYVKIDNIERTGEQWVDENTERVHWGTETDATKLSNGSISKKNNYLLPGNEEINLNLEGFKGKATCKMGGWVKKGNGVEVYFDNKLVKVYSSLGQKGETFTIPANVENIMIRYNFSPQSLELQWGPVQESPFSTVITGYH